MGSRSLVESFNKLDKTVTHWMAESGLTLLRVSIGIVYIWFGALKLFPGLSPAEPLIEASYDFLPFSPDILVRLIGLLEVVIGLGLALKLFLRTTLLLMGLQILGTLSPVVLAPDRVFTIFPFGLTMEGQFMVKNAVLTAAAIVIGATVRGGGLTEKPEVMAVDDTLDRVEQKLA